MYLYTSSLYSRLANMLIFELGLSELSIRGIHALRAVLAVECGECGIA